MKLDNCLTNNNHHRTIPSVSIDFHRPLLISIFRTLYLLSLCNKKIIITTYEVLQYYVVVKYYYYYYFVVMVSQYFRDLGYKIRKIPLWNNNIIMPCMHGASTLSWRFSISSSIYHHLLLHLYCYRNEWDWGLQLAEIQNQECRWRFFVSSLSPITYYLSARTMIRHLPISLSKRAKNSGGRLPWHDPSFSLINILL